ncbi:sodium-dependent nutrient amino acid transporter 1-like [Culex quinquefasciatus]|uniref:sodium-dependent nutrient amino acid transporter 1-like n=1 Tax=Culex quinquefasciatus TaxID=7176 RepID=UPI0018E33238|nr:sodium-dependent nutrient amino acid transporter 1-like [Culex quinquefasciatus]
MPAENSWNVNDVLKSPELLVLSLNVGEFDENVKIVSPNGGCRDVELVPIRSPVSNADSDSGITREKWSKNVEFLLSCVALSVGFGNIWRFPYTALKNGGGAFLIPYLIVLFVVGRPLYYLEMVMGQFSSRGCVKVFDVSPLMRGVGVGQTMTFFTIVGYYAALMAIAIRYLMASFEDPLPWSVCPQGVQGCLNSSLVGLLPAGNETRVVSAELYFKSTIINAVPNLNDGIGLPDLKLALCLLACWSIVTAILIKGIKTSGKASYFLAIFPYVILIVLLGRSCTLEGAKEGILHFVTPQWDKLLDKEVWFAAITQCFYSLTVGLGAVIVFASFNSFPNNIYRDAMIISWLDTLTSILSGVIVFGVVGNLAHVTNQNVPDVMKAGPELTFITYPDAIAKMDFAPNFFAVMFFLMFILLGLGSNVGIVQTIVTAIRDMHPQLQTWKVVLGVTICGFFCGLVYITPAGLLMLDVVEYPVIFASLTLVILEAVTFCWIYGVNRICQDIKFMLGIETGIFWRLCWGVLTPAIIIAVFILQFTKDAAKIPIEYTIFGWCLYAFIVLQVVGWGVYAVMKQPEKRVCAKIAGAISPTKDWGPESNDLKKEYDVAIRRYKESLRGNWLNRLYCRVFK